MRIGYPCINLSLDCRPSRTFRLSNLSWGRLRETVAGNLACLERILHWNAERRLLFFRITSDLVPLASHPANRFPWDEFFAPDFARLGKFIRGSGMRISMHPGQYTLLNSPRSEVVTAACADLAYHARVLELMGLDATAKIQIHIGGLYGDKQAALERFVRAVEGLEPRVRARLVVENDERLFNLKDCLWVNRRTGLPILLDVFHHEIYSDGRTLPEALVAAAKTWQVKDGLPMIDYSSPLPGGRLGSHAHKLDELHFRRFLKEIDKYDFDVMLEVKDKERSALRALEIVRAVVPNALYDAHRA
ncbi:MAG: UV DNA damage repair endonuclease UvsE [Candidatus Bipolaricaulota bacterium]|nr:UV DNA damage repair endonuclease UvsE [Candidatus Bipolaricaulota bacterium]MDW8141579.1 UV DNA damage repair endonuclease UvsE [Candidatus Bipolaricaulota bacterium]